MMKTYFLTFTLFLMFACNNSNLNNNSENSTALNDISFSALYRTGSNFNQPFRRFLDLIESTNITERQLIALNFLQQQNKIPLIESDTIVHFLFWGKAGSVAVAGDATAWTPNQKLENIGGTDLWFSTATYPAETRFEYKLVIDSTNWVLDSLNKQKVLGGMGENSELTLPAYVKPLYISEVDSIPKGTYFDKYIQSTFLKEKRKFRVYLPPAYENATVNYPIIFFHDGIQFFDMTASFNMFNNLISENKIQPFIAVFVDPVQRDEEYSGSLQENYTEFIVNELLPFMDSGFRTIPNALNRVQSGISNGGNIALWIVASHPETFTKVAALSSNVEDKINTELEKDKTENLKIYLLKSKYELPMLIPRINKLEKTISTINCEALICEYPEGHNWAFWQKHLPEALEYLFPPVGN